jgi:hypothetical protein
MVVDWSSTNARLGGDWLQLGWGGGVKPVVELFLTDKLPVFADRRDIPSTHRWKEDRPSNLHSGNRAHADNRTFELPLLVNQAR